MEGAVKSIGMYADRKIPVSSFPKHQGNEEHKC